MRSPFARVGVGGRERLDAELMVKILPQPSYTRSADDGRKGDRRDKRSGSRRFPHGGVLGSVLANVAEQPLPAFRVGRDVGLLLFQVLEQGSGAGVARVGCFGGEALEDRGDGFRRRLDLRALAL